MSRGPVRRAVVAGSWYPGSASALAREVNQYLSAASGREVGGSIDGLVAPHAGLMYSGPVAAWAYRAVQGRRYDLAVLVGPSHHVPFDGVAIVSRGEFDTPLGPAPIHEEAAAAILAAGEIVYEYPMAHAREHSLELQLPFLRRVLPDVPIVPLVMGLQSPSTIRALAATLEQALAGRRALLVASSDLSHYLDAESAAEMDRAVLDAVGRFDAEGLLALVERDPDHACGGGPIVAVMKAARSLGAREGRVLEYADSGDVSGDKSAVVGYMAAVFGTFGPVPGGAPPC